MTETVCPSEPPIGTWVKDKYGAASVRCADGWAPAPSGFFACGRWEAMWEARGPLVECEPWGKQTPEEKVAELRVQLDEKRREADKHLLGVIEAEEQMAKIRALINEIEGSKA